jgi:hypothetical protein
VSLASLGLQTHGAHQPLDPASRMAVPFPAQFRVDAGCAIDRQYRNFRVWVGRLIPFRPWLV